MKLVYVNYTDIASTKGNSINERGFVRAMLGLDDFESVYVGPQTSENLEYDASRHEVRLISAGRGILSTVIYQAKLYRELARIKKSNQGNLVLCCRPHFFSLTPLLFSRIHKIPMISKEAGLGVELYKKHRSSGRLIRFVSSKARELNGQRADLVWCVTNAIRNYWVDEKSVPAKRVFVLPNGADITLFRPDVEPSLPKGVSLNRRWEWCLLYAGHLNKHVSGLESLLVAVSRLKQSGVDIGLIVAGDGEQRARLESLSEEMDISDNTVFAGWLDYKDMPALYAYCDVSTALLGRAFLKSHGSSSQKVLQSVSMGMPVLAGRADDHAFIEENGFGVLSDPEDPDEIVESLKAIIAQGKRAREFSGFNYVQEHFSYKSIATAVMVKATSLV